jgi:hypothetical protein
MSEYKDYVEQNESSIRSDFQKYMVEINKVRNSYGLLDMQFSPKHFEEFERQWVESRSI